MSWHYSQAVVEACSPDDYWDGEQSQLLNLMNTAAKYFSKGKMRDGCIPSQSGMTLEHSTGDHFVDAWILLQQDFHVNRSVQQDINSVTTTPGISGLKHLGSFKKLNPNSHTWKMSLSYCLQDTLHKWPEIWPRAGIVLSGECYQPPNWAHRICEIESGLLPTPAASEGCRVVGKSQYSRHTPGLAAQLGGTPHPEYLEWMMGWPTGWTALEPLETDKFQEWLDLHGAC